MTYFRINPVLALLLLLTAIAAALPFISYAPNRLVSGEGRHLWQLWPQTLWMLVGVGCAWLTACFIPAKKGSIFALILAQFVFVLLVWGAGKAATQLAQNGSALARTIISASFPPPFFPFPSPPLFLFFLPFFSFLLLFLSPFFSSDPGNCSGGAYRRAVRFAYRTAEGET